MQIFNSFSELFNAQCFNNSFPSSFFSLSSSSSQDIVLFPEVQVDNDLTDGLADISLFLNLLNASPNPYAESFASEFNMSSLYTEQKKTEIEIKGDVKKTTNDLRNIIVPVVEEIMPNRTFSYDTIENIVNWKRI